MNGIQTTWEEEMNFRIELFFGLGVLVLAKYLNFTLLEWIIIIGCIGAILSAEMVNTAIEDLCDHIEPTHNQVIGKIKDITAGFVLITVSAVTVIITILFLNHI